MAVFLNIDAGELPAEPEALCALAHRVHVACGGHAGDADSMRTLVARCLAHGTELGVHPSFPDRGNFGRVPMTLAPEELTRTIEAQCAALLFEARRLGVPIVSLKAHGALYHAGNRDSSIATSVIAAAEHTLGPIEIVGPPDGAWRSVALQASLPFRREGFADRAYQNDGTLVPRVEPGALIHDPEQALQQALRLLRSGNFDTLCVHGDAPNALAVAQAVRRAIDCVSPSVANAD